MDGFGRTAVWISSRNLSSGKAVIGLFAAAGSYLAELSKSGAASFAVFPCSLCSGSLSLSDPELSGVGRALGLWDAGNVTSNGFSPMDGNRGRKNPPGVAVFPCPLELWKPPGVPPGDIAVSAIGVIPGP